MADKRFFTNKGPFTLAQLADMVPGASLVAKNNQEVIEDIAPLDVATSQMLSFFTNIKYADQVRASKAGVCVLQAEHQDIAPDGMSIIIAKNAYYAYALIAQAFYPEEHDISSEAVASTTKIGKGTHISVGTVIGDHVEIGNNTFIGRNCVIARGVVIGDNVVIKDNVTISHALIGDRVRIFPGVCIGQDGFGFATHQGRHVSIPQLGRVIIGNDVEIGANGTVDRGAGPDTVIGDGCRLDNLVQVAHNVQLGKGCVIVSQAGVAGSSVLEDYVVLGGQVGVAGHLRVGMGAQVAGQSGVIQNVAPGQKLGGSPAVPLKQWHKQSVMLARMVTKKNNKS